MDAWEDFSDLKEEIRRAIATGIFRGTGAATSADDLTARWGQPERVVVRKGVKTVSYPGTDFLFESHALRQVTVKVQDDRQQAALQELLREFPSEMADRVPPYFRCLRLDTGTCALEQVLVTTADAPQGAPMSVAMIFPKKATQGLELELPRELYERLQALSNARRQTIAQLCEELIARSLEHEEEKKEK